MLLHRLGLSGFGARRRLRARALGLFVACAVWANREARADSVQGRFLAAPNATAAPLRWEVADTLSARAQGLMFRRRVPPKHGMLFVFDDAAPRSFWMKDTYVSLDMVFADASCRIVHIIEHASPHSTASHGCRQPSQYVVEVPAGTARALGATEGGVLQFVHGQGAHAVQCPTPPRTPSLAP